MNKHCQRQKSRCKNYPIKPDFGRSEQMEVGEGVGVTVLSQAASLQSVKEWESVLT